MATDASPTAKHPRLNTHYEPDTRNQPTHTRPLPTYLGSSADQHTHTQNTQTKTPTPRANLTDLKLTYTNLVAAIVSRLQYQPQNGSMLISNQSLVAWPESLCLESSEAISPFMLLAEDSSLAPVRHEHLGPFTHLLSTWAPRFWTCSLNWACSVPSSSLSRPTTTA